jgi:DNA-binding HxlR family transcriptional regulator
MEDGWNRRLYDSGDRAKSDPPGSKDPTSLELEFRRFGDTASEFVKMVSAEGGIAHRGEPATVKDNLDIMKKVFGKWSLEILMSTYSMKSVGFGDLRRVLNGISSRVLSKKLKDLEGLGLLQRSVIESRPPRVRYSLSERGEVLAKLGEPVILYLRSSME